MKRTIQGIKDQQDKKLVTIKEAAKILGVSRQSLYFYRLAELIIPVPTKNGRILFERTAVLELKEKINAQNHKS